ncbi:nucleotidyltransferase family protein [Solimonas terrae]|uniref:Nucleotidyltransferase family protein n=1 Tax=Solimonas terrae TaxID=1396819 RepID=A0A6M2BRL6_9GAMM|nr:nucleotidyltransferase family protein [Solimonas terrae]
MRIAAIVLAAGRSRRFGHANKLLAPLHGEPLWWRTLDAVRASRARPVVIVLGHQQRLMRLSLQRYRRLRRCAALPCVVNRDYRSGMAGSLQLGLASLPARVDGALICLGDMPGVRRESLDRLCRAYRRGDDAALPVCDGQRGNPALLGRPLFAAVRQQLRHDEGARRLIAGAAAVREVRGTRADLRDVDTRGDWQRLLRGRNAVRG